VPWVEQATELLAGGQRSGSLLKDRSNAGVAHQLWVTEGTVEKHVRSILMKPRIRETTDDHRRVPAVLTFLDSN
jgi:hypothetical protein